MQGHLLANEMQWLTAITPCTQGRVHGMVQNGPTLSGVMGGVWANGPGLPKIANGPGRTNLKKMVQIGPNRLGFTGPSWAEENFEWAGRLILPGPVQKENDHARTFRTTYTLILSLFNICISYLFDFALSLLISLFTALVNNI